MRFPFSYYETRNGAIIGTYEGHANIERDPSNSEEWFIESVALDGLVPGEFGLAFPKSVEVPLTQDDRLGEKIWLWLYTPEQRRAIDEEWNQHLLRCKAAREAA